MHMKADVAPLTRCVVCDLCAVHAHVVLWVHPDDFEEAALGISAAIPGVKNKDGNWECAPGAGVC
jgi:hypothetical protein